MATLLKLGPADHGRPMSWDEYIGGEYKEGYKYELIAGRLYVSPAAGFPEKRIELWLYEKLTEYRRLHAGLFNLVSIGGRVFVPGAGEHEVTSPEPDVTAFLCDDPNAPDANWREFTPVLVAEVLVDSDPDKDLVRNVDLYFRIPSVREYWVLDGREDRLRPTLVARRRCGGRWVVRNTPGGGTYQTHNLPGFALTLDVRQ